MSNETYHARGVLVHGYRVRKHPLYAAWAGMKERCNNQLNPGYENYGGRGITYYERWKVFANFAEDMWPKPPGTSLERKDNNKGYSLDNCVWATAAEQARNRRTFKNSQTGVTGIVPIKNGFNARYDDNHIRYELGNFNIIEEAVAQRNKFIQFYTENDPTFYEMLSKGSFRVQRDLKTERRLRRDSQTGVKGITVHKQGFVVRKTVEPGERLYLGFSKTFEGAVKILRGAAR